MRALDHLDKWLFATIGLGIATFCVADMNAILALVALPIWLLSWFLVQGPQGMPLPRVVILSLVAAATLKVVGSIIATPGDLIEGVSEYLVWLHLIKLYDKRGPRDHGQLLLMSLFLVLGACLVSNRLALAGMLVAYLPLFVWTAMLHQLQRGQRGVEEQREQLKPADRRRFPPKPTLGARPTGAFATLVVTALLGASVVSALVFLVTPRRPISSFGGRWVGPPIGTQSGFTDEVRLGASGFISESPTAVLDLTLTSPTGSNLGPSTPSVYLRGAVLDEYSDGGWRRSASAPRMIERRVFPGEPMEVSRAVRGVELVIAEINFRNKRNAALFTIYRPIAFEFERPVEFRYSRDDQMVELDASGRVRYTLRAQPDAPDPFGTQTETRPTGFQGGAVQELAESLMADAGLSRPDDVIHSESDRAIAERFERHLQRNFTYTTLMEAPNLGDDPIDAFLFDRQRGHCEYFAASLAAMCRSVGINARVVTGYLATEFDPDSGEYTVREADAHAWTEVNVGPGAWETFDASPPAGLATSLRRPDGLLWSLRNFWDQIERAWIQSVVSFNEEDRRELVGDSSSAAGEALQEFGARMRSLERSQWRDRIIQALMAGATVFAVTAAAGLGAIRLLAVWRARRRARRRWREQATSDPTFAERFRQASFYRAFQRAARKAGVERAEWESPRAHARRLGAMDAALGDAADRLVGFYYDVRWGRRVLDEDEMAAASDALEFAETRLDGRAPSEEESKKGASARAA